jgi:hypothetical protein
MTAAHVSFTAEYIVVIPLSLPEISPTTAHPNVNIFRDRKFIITRTFLCPTAVRSVRVSKTTGQHTAIKMSLRFAMFKVSINCVAWYIPTI